MQYAHTHRKQCNSNGGKWMYPGILVCMCLLKKSTWKFFVVPGQSGKVCRNLMFVWHMFIRGSPVFCEQGGIPFGFKKKTKKNKDHGIWWDYSSVTDRQGAVSHFGYVHIRSRSMVPPDQCHFRRSNTQTDPSDALAPTLSPVAFQQTSKMPPVPR